MTLRNGGDVFFSISPPTRRHECAGIFAVGTRADAGIIVACWRGNKRTTDTMYTLYDNIAVFARMHITIKLPQPTTNARLLSSGLPVVPVSMACMGISTDVI